MCENLDLNSLKELFTGKEAPKEEEKDDSSSNYSLQLAVAGFSSDEIEVYSDRRYIYVNGDNSKNTKIAKEFKDSFAMKYLIPNCSLDVEKIKVILLDGLLYIDIPVRKKEMVFGKKNG